MIILNDFSIKVEKNKVLNLIDCDKNNTLYDYAIDLFYKSERDFYKIIKPRGAFILKENISYDFDKAIFVLYTIGKEVSEFISKLFDEGNYFEGIILNAIADNYLLQMDKVFCKNIHDIYLNRGLKFTKRLTPAENIDIKYQKDICTNLQSKSLLGIDINKNYILEPLKSSSFIVGVGESLQFKTVFHNCDECSLKECKWRGNL